MALETKQDFRLSSVFRYLVHDTVHRSLIICRRLSTYSISVLAFVPKAYAQSGTSNSSNLTTSDVNNLIALFDFFAWKEEASSIRAGNSRGQCLAKLSTALAAYGPLTIADDSASSGALTLLPTAGALIGTPTKELWVVYKLMPIAGVLSMLLSLGGNIVPTDARDYELNASAFSYGGMIATDNEEELEDREDRQQSSESEAKLFAARVEQRSKDVRGGTKYVRVWYGIVLQCLWLAVLLATCWFTQSGSIIVWWCKVSFHGRL